MSNVDMRVTLAGMTMKTRWWWPPGPRGRPGVQPIFDLSELGGICAKG